MYLGIQHQSTNAISVCSKASLCDAKHPHPSKIQTFPHDRDKQKHCCEHCRLLVHWTGVFGHNFSDILKMLDQSKINPVANGDSTVATLFALCYEMLLLKTTGATDEKSEVSDLTQSLKRNQSTLSVQHQPEKQPSKKKGTTPSEKKAAVLKNKQKLDILDQPDQKLINTAGS